MAIKDPKARRVTFHYTGGSISGALGLLDEILEENLDINTAEVTVDSRGRRRLKNLITRASAAGGRQIMILHRDGKEYQIRYRGSLVDFRLNCVPQFDRSKVIGWATIRGKKQGLF